MAGYSNDIFALMRALQSLREEDEQMPTQMAAVFLSVALQPGLTMSELGQHVGMSQASCSRNVAALGEWHRFGKAGLNLVESVEDPRERRRKIMFLTVKGRNRVAKVISALTGNPVSDFNSPTAKEWMTTKVR
jgi:DNA-binding MarR family transcriptional regulator